MDVIVKEWSGIWDQYSKHIIDAIVVGLARK